MYGIMPFNLDTKRPLASACPVSMAYSICYATFVAVVIPFLQIYHFKCVLARGITRRTLLIVIALNLSVLSIRSILSSIQQMLNWKVIVALINEGYQLSDQLLQLRYANEIETIQQASCRSVELKMLRIIRWKIVYSTIQFAIAIGSVVCDRYYGSAYYQIIPMVLSTHGLYLLTTGTYFCAMLVALRFFCLLNRRIKLTMARIEVIALWMTKSKHRQWDQICDDIDQTHRLYERITVFTSRINRLFSFQLLLAILASFGFALTGVKF